MIPEVVFVTGNENKWKEVQAILGDGIRVIRAKLDCKLPSLSVWMHERHNYTLDSTGTTGEH